MTISILEFTEGFTSSDFLWHLQRGDTGDKNANAKKKWFEEKQKRKHAELEKLGLDTTEIHRIETAEQVDITASLRPVLCGHHRALLHPKTSILIQKLHPIL